MKNKNNNKCRCRCRSYNRPDWGGDEDEVMLTPPEWSEKQGICVDPCIVDTIKMLWDNKIKTMGCCCGHNGAGHGGRPSVYVDNKELAYELLKDEGRDWLILV